MDVITIPRGLRDGADGLSAGEGTLVNGPFALIHNGIRGVGYWLEYNGLEHVVYDGANPWVIDDSYTVHTSDDTITLYSDRFKSKFVIRPLTQSDVSWLTDGEDLPIDELKDMMYRAASTYDNS